MPSPRKKEKEIIPGYAAGTYLITLLKRLARTGLIILQKNNFSVMQRFWNLLTCEFEYNDHLPNVLSNKRQNYLLTFETYHSFPLVNICIASPSPWRYVSVHREFLLSSTLAFRNTTFGCVSTAY